MPLSTKSATWHHRKEAFMDDLSRSLVLKLVKVANQLHFALGGHTNFKSDLTEKKKKAWATFSKLLERLRHTRANQERSDILIHSQRQVRAPRKM